MNLKKLLPIIGVILFGYILLKLDISKIFEEIKHADIFYLILALIFVGVVMFIQTLKWFAIARKQQIKIPFLEAIKVTMISNFYNVITPSKLGTVIRVKYLKKYTTNVGKGFSNFVLDKILDLSSIFFMAIVLLIVFRGRLASLPLSLFIVVFLILMVITIIFMNKDRSKIILKFFYKRLVPKKMQEKAKSAFESFYEDLPKKQDFILFFILNILTWINVYLVTFFVGRAVGINLPFSYFLAILPIGTIVAMIPVSINGLGTREAAFISLFALFGVSATKVFAMSILSLFLGGIIPAIIGSFFIFKERDK